MCWPEDSAPGSSRLQPPAQVACKDTAFDPWFEDYNSEAQLTRRVYAAGCRNVIKVIDWLPNPRRKYTRIISEYCRHGSLLNVWNFYEKNQMSVFHASSSARSAADILFSPPCSGSRCPKLFCGTFSTVWRLQFVTIPMEAPMGSPGQAGFPLFTEISSH